MGIDCLIKNARIVVPRQGIVEACIGIQDGVIAAISLGQRAEPLVSSDTKVIDVDGRYVLPGVIDPHTHFGRRSLPDEFLTETRSAALSGVTTLFNFFSRPSTYTEYYSQIKEAGEQFSHIDFGLHFAIMTDGQLAEIEHYVSRYGVRSFKFFLCYKGEEGKAMGLEGCDDGLLYEGFSRIASIDRAVACVHCENGEVIPRIRNRLRSQGRDDLAAWSESRPNFCEAESIERACYFARVTRCPTYIVHLTTREGLEVVRQGKQRFDKTYVETCPHYLTHTAYAAEGNLAKHTPPLRYEADIEALWTGLMDGTIDTVGSDHVANVVKEHKQGSIWDCAPGFPGTATILPVLLSEGVNRRGMSLERVAEVTSYNAARIFGLYPRKGTIQVGSDADLTVIDLDIEKTVTAEMLGAYSDISLYEGHSLRGWPLMTMVRGNVIVEDGSLVGRHGYGRYLCR